MGAEMRVTAFIIISIILSACSSREPNNRVGLLLKDYDNGKLSIKEFQVQFNDYRKKEMLNLTSFEKCLKTMKLSQKVDTEIVSKSPLEVHEFFESLFIKDLESISQGKNARRELNQLKKYTDAGYTQLVNFQLKILKLSSNQPK